MVHQQMEVLFSQVRLYQMTNHLLKQNVSDANKNLISFSFSCMSILSLIEV